MRLALSAVGAAATLAAAAPMQAQSVDRRCTGTFAGPQQIGGDACQKVIDLYKYINVQLGTSVAGGNATLGQGGALGGLGHFAIGVRANAMRASVPDVAATGLQEGPAGSPDNFEVESKWAGLPAVDAAVGVFRGIPLGVTHVGGVDVLMSGAYLPDITVGSVSVATPNGSLKLGVGARVGIVEESLVTPGVSFTLVRRGLPTMSIVADAGSDRSISVEDYHVRTTAWRLVASKNFALVGLSAGIGQDKYHADANLTYDVDGFVPAAPLALGVAPTRTNVFGGVSLNLALVKVVGEVGRASGGDVTTYNTFDTGANDARYYGSLGVRVGH
jgi:hypothetical protein